MAYVTNLSGKKKIVFFTIFILHIIGAAVWFFWQRSPSVLEGEGVSLEEDAKVEDGTLMGYISALYEADGARYMDMDEAEWLTGEEAAQAMIEDGECIIADGEDESACTPDGFYVRNPEVEVRTLPIASEVTVTRSTDFEYSDTGTHQISYEELQHLFSGEGSYFRSIPFHVGIKDGVIISITEQYLP